MSVAVGIGYDVHRFAEGRRLVLGGVELEHDRGLAGHSDADVLAHAVIDALLGAAGLGDIGQHFPDDDEGWRDADSMELLSVVMDRAGREGCTVTHVDVTVVLEAPKLAPYRERIRERLAGVLNVETEQVNVKGTRGEGMGFVGRQEGAAALAAVTVERA